MQEKLAVTFLVTMLALFGLVVVLYQMIEENNEDYTQIVLRQHSSYDSRTLPYRRGDIVDRNGTYLATSEMGFGGFGPSGMGSYHGKDGFRTFSHYKSIVDKKLWLDLPMRYQPYRFLYEKMVRFFLR